ncbi:MAG TPA: hypothetical protein VNU01_02860 [Egibacteraceae bacterium]|nr:hypothetical protein [Egibacteraceae bacterium]
MGDSTILDGGGISCWAVDLERDYPLASALAATWDAGPARFLIRLPDDVFGPTGVVGRVDLGRGEAVFDLPPPPGLAGLPYFDAAALLAAVLAEAPSWVYLGRTEEGARFGRRDMAVAAALDRDWVVVAATIGGGGRLRSVEYLLPAQATLRPAVLRLFDFDGAEPLDHAAAVPS